LEATDTAPRHSLPASGDYELVRRAAGGEAAAFETLFEKYREAVYAAAWRYTGNKETALEFTQEAFVRAYEKLATFRRESNFYTWIRRIVTNLCIDHLRSRASQSVPFDEAIHGEARGPVEHEEATPALRKAEDAELTGALWRALDKLSESHRTVFMLHAVDGMTYKQIADSMNCSMGTVMSRLHYARKNLQEMLKSHLSA
jgi:RNA polymerase sigma-70 factor, ECF subfamily